MPSISNHSTSKMNPETSTSSTSKGRKTAQPSKKAAAPAPEEASSLTFLDLDALAKKLGAPDTAFASRTFRTAKEADLVDAGTEVDSQNVLDDVPRFAGSAVTIWGSLSPGQRELVRLPQPLFSLLVHEAVTLRGMKASHDAQTTDTAAGKVERETRLRAAMREGIHARDIAYDSFRNALGDGRIDELNRIVGNADGAEKLAQGLTALADLLARAAKADPEAALSLEEYGAGPERVQALREHAKKVRELGQATATSSRRVTQRALDLQDGRVLLLIGKILRAFRAARRADATILVPELNRLARLFETQRRSSAGPSEPAAPAEPVVASSPA